MLHSQLVHSRTTLRMRKLLLVPSLLAVIVALLLGLMRSEKSLLFLAHWSVDYFTDLRLVLRQPVLRPLQGQVSAAELHLYPKAMDAPPFLSVLGLQGDVDAGDIYRGNLFHSRLSAGQVIIYISSRDQTADPLPVHWLRFLSWLPEALDIKQLHVVSEAQETLIFPLQDISGNRPEHGMFRGKATALYEGEPLAVELDLLAIVEREQATGLDMTARIIAPESDSIVSLKGELRGNREQFNYDFLLDGDYKEVARFVEGFDTPGSLEGALTLEARMRGNAEGFSLTNTRIILDNTPDYVVEAHGRMDYRFDGGNRLELTAAGELTSMDVILRWMNIDLTPLGRAQGYAAVVGSLEHPVIEDFILRSENTNGLSVNLRGRLDPLNTHTSENRVKVDIHAPALATLEYWTGPLPHEPGPLSISGEILGAEDGLRLENFIAETGSTETILLRMEGSASAAPLAQRRGLAAVNNVALELSLFTPDSEQLAPYVSANIPPGFELSGTVELSGNGSELHIRGGQINAESSDISAALRPGEGSLLLTEERLLRDFAGELELYLSDTSALSQFFTAPVPVLGQVSARAQLRQHGDHYSLEGIKFTLDGEGPLVRGSGSIADIVQLDGLVIDSSYSGIRAGDILNTVMQEFTYTGELADLSGGFTLRHRDKQWSITDFKVNSAGANSNLELQASGRLLDITGLPSITLEAEYELRDPALIEALSGLRTKPGDGRVTIRSRDGKTQVNGSVRFGNSGIGVRSELTHANRSLEALKLELSSPSVRLEDLGLQVDKQRPHAYNPSDQLEEIAPGQRLQNALQHAPRYDTDITINLQGLTGEHTNIKSLHLNFTGTEQRYTLRRLSVAYGQSLTEVRGIIDLNSAPPFVSLAGELVAIPLDTLSRDLGLDFDIKGIGNLRGGLTARGSSGQELLASVDGSVAIALQDAVIEGAAYDVLATDLLAWFYSGAALEESTRIDCTMGRFTFNQGVARSDGFYAETRKMVATGTAKLDFGKQWMDVQFTPRSKSRSLQVPSSIKIRGDFSNPKVTISPIAAAFDAYAEVLSLLPQMARRVFGNDGRKRSERPCEPNAA